MGVPGYPVRVHPSLRQCEHATEPVAEDSEETKEIVECRV